MNAAQADQRDARSESLPIRYSIGRIIVLLITLLLIWNAVASIRFGASYLAFAVQFAIFALIYYAGRLSGQRRRLREASVR